MQQLPLWRGSHVRAVLARSFGLLDRVFGWIAAHVWVYVGILWSALVVCRASVVMVVAGWLLLASEQGQDVLLALAQGVGSDEGPFWHGYQLLIATLLSLSFWTISTWYWALTMLRFDLPRWTPARLQGSRRTWTMFLVWMLPTVLGLATIAAFAFNLAPDIRGLSAVAKLGFLRLEIGAGVLATVFVLYERLHRLWLRIREKDLRRQQISDIWSKTKGRFTGRSKGGAIATWVLLITAAVGTIMLVASWVAPVTVGRHFRTDIFFFVWAGSMIPVLSVFVYFTEHYRIPVMTILVGLAILFSARNDNHMVRFLDRAAANADQRPTVTDAARAWFAPPATLPSAAAEQAAGRKRPLVIVATAGGGSRAAYWTATVLGRLQDCYPEFARHTFAISGVSGGSLGAAAFRAVLTDLPPADTRRTAAPGCGPHTAVAVEGGVAEKAQEVVGNDFLTATIATMLYPDLLQRFLPLPIESADRARAIELAWEDSYRRAMALPPEAGDGRFADSFINAAAPGSADGDAAAKRWPALFLNATWVETGRRLVLSPLRLGDTPDRKIAAFPAADDLLALIGRDIALSTAASLSARFPLVLPAGTLVDSAGQSHGRVVDGGYFENFGAVTAAEVMAEVRRALGADAASVHPVVILISSDPSLPNPLGAPCNRPKENGGLGESSAARCPVNEIEYAPGVRSPLRAFSKTRQTRGILAALNLEAMAADIGGEFVTFRLCSADPTAQGDGGDPPLGWALSAFAKTMIDGQFTDLDSKEDACRRINRESWEAIHAVFGATSRHQE